jgi:predicted nucleic acid-binding protein
VWTLIVVDASAILEMLFATPAGLRVAARLSTSGTTGTQIIVIAAPQLLLIECLQVLRRSALRGDITDALAAELATDLLALDLAFYDHDLVAQRVWELRGNLTAYDATYVALSELLNAPLLTNDAKLAAAPGNRATIEMC